MLGLLGALDPYKKQLQESRTRRSKMGTPHSKPLTSKKEGRLLGLGMLCEERGHVRVYVSCKLSE